MDSFSVNKFTNMSTSNSLDIYVMVRDRPEFIKQCLESVRASSLGLANVIVSDNSQFDYPDFSIITSDLGFAYVRRKPQFNSIFQHFKAVILESKAEYIVVFHDDDLMLPGYVSELLRFISDHPYCSAVASNAIVMRNDQVTSQTIMHESNKFLTIDSHIQILKHYMSLSSHAAAPFPSYMYRRNIVNEVFPEISNAGKHADIIILLSLITISPIIWLHTPLMIYRVHNNHLSSTETIPDRIQLLKYVSNLYNINRKSAFFVDYKLSYWIGWVSQNCHSTRFVCNNKRKLLVVFLFLSRNITRFLALEFLRLFVFKFLSVVTAYLSFCRAFLKKKFN